MPGRTVWEEALTASTTLADVETRLAICEQSLGDPAVYGDETRLATVLEEQARLLKEYEELGGPSYEGRVWSALNQVGFDSDQAFYLATDALCGGQKKLRGLAKLLVVQPSLLLLDEPDNHLDLAGKTLLEELVQSYKGGVVIVSHDRYLLDVVASEIAEREDGRIIVYPGNYSEYVFEKQTRLLRQQQLFQAQTKQINRLEQAAHRLLIWGRSHDNPKLIKRGQAIEKRIERIERIDKPVTERQQMALELSGWRGSNKVLDIRNLDEIFPTSTLDGEENIVLAGLDLLLWRGERVELVGATGSGKSVLFRLILGQDEPSGGGIIVGLNVQIGYYAQEHETLDYDRTLIETIHNAAPFNETYAVNFLGRFLFNYDQARSPVHTLSSGERSRL